MLLEAAFALGLGGMVQAAESSTHSGQLAPPRKWTDWIKKPLKVSLYTPPPNENCLPLRT